MRVEHMLYLRRLLLWAAISLFGIALGVVRLVSAAETRPFEVVIATASTVTEERTAGWKGEGFRAVAVVLDDGDAAVDLEKAAKAVSDHSLGLYFWIEVGRNPAFARVHPDWMASLGIHNDWRKRFPNVRPLEKGEVAKVWPWVPIRYREAYDAHLKRIQLLLARAPDGYRGVLLNDLQGGPASCGCGNLQCRWATDYGVASTTVKLDGADIAARFVREVGKSINGKEVIPIWTTECEREDLSTDKLPQGSWSTGYCGEVPCLETCRKRFNEQWTALEADRRGPTGLLLLEQEFQRDRKEYGGIANWMNSVVESIEKQGDKPYPPERLWLVIQGYGTTADDETALRQAAVKTGAGAVLVARTRIDQSYEPRIVEVKPAP